MKTLIRNVAVLDLTTVKKETAEGLTIGNAASVLVSPATKDFLSLVNFNNLACITEVPENTKLNTITGSITIDGDDDTNYPNTFWLVNGSMLIKENMTAETIKSMFSAGIQINGCAYVPEKISAVFSSLVTINGAITTYPAGGLFFENELNINNGFLNGLEQGTVIIALNKVFIDEKTDPELLVSKIGELRAQHNVILPEKLSEAFYKIARSYNEVIEIPEGYKMTEIPSEINEASVYSLKGKKIFTREDVIFGQDLDEDVLRQLNFKIKTTAKVYMPKHLTAVIMDNVEAAGFSVYGGRLTIVKDEMTYTPSAAVNSYLIKKWGTLTITESPEKIDKIFLLGTIKADQDYIEAVRDKIALNNGELLLNADEEVEEDEEDSFDESEFDVVVGNAAKYKL